MNTDRNIDNDGIIGSCNCLTKTPLIEHHKKGCKYRLISERDQLQAEVQWLRSALEFFVQTCDTAPPTRVMEYLSTACEKAREALSPSAPAVVPEEGRLMRMNMLTGEVEEASQGEWREFVPSPENPFQLGDQWQDKSRPDLGWSTGIESRVGGYGTSVHSRYRRFHPATTNQEDGQ